MEQINLVKVFKALSNDQRLNLFKFIYEWNETCQEESTCEEGVEKCFTKACGLLKLSRSTISHHFKELQNSGLIIVTRNGQSYICKVNAEAMAAIRSFLE